MAGFPRDRCELWKVLLLLHLTLVEDFPISMLVEPDGIGVLADEFFRVRRSP